MSDKQNKGDLKPRVGELESQVGETEIAVAANRLSQVLQGSSIPTFVIDSRHVTIHWNRACENLTGIPADEVLGTRKQWMAFYSSERPVMADLIVDRTSEEKIEQFYKDKYQRSSIIDGAYEAEGFFPELGEKGKWLFFTAAPLRDAGGNIVGALETLQDVTTRKQAEQALRESEERYRILTEHIADGVMLTQGGEFVFTNQAFNKMFGYQDSRDLIGRKIGDVFPESLEKPVRESLGPTKEGASGRDCFQGRCSTREGMEFWVEMYIDTILLHGKPAVLATMRDITENVLEKRAMTEEAEHLRQENLRLRSTVKDRYRFGEIIGKSEAMQEVYELVLKASTTDANVMIYGESGTGKELVAKAIHDMSERRARAFVPVNCGAIPENLVESEFFGYKKGAFTGANRDKTGYLDVADKGTLFLDEVGEISLNMQVKLLRAVGQGRYTPVGSSEAKEADIRIIAATNADLTRMVREGRMREDFYYRISIIPIRLPPLRERKEDLPLLIEHYWREYGARDDSPLLTGEIIEALMNHDWPGNVRELQNVLHRYLTLQKVDFLPGKSFTSGKAHDPKEEEPFHGPQVLRTAIETLEKKLISRSLSLNRWHRGKAAIQLGIDPKTLLKKIKMYGLAKSSGKK